MYRYTKYVLWPTSPPLPSLRHDDCVKKFFKKSLTFKRNSHRYTDNKLYGYSDRVHLLYSYLIQKATGNARMGMFFFHYITVWFFRPSACVCVLILYNICADEVGFSICSTFFFPADSVSYICIWVIIWFIESSRDI